MAELFATNDLFIKTLLCYCLVQRFFGIFCFQIISNYWKRTGRIVLRFCAKIPNYQYIFSFAHVINIFIIEKLLYVYFLSNNSLQISFSNSVYIYIIDIYETI